MNRLNRLTRQVKKKAGIGEPCAIIIFCDDAGKWEMHLPNVDNRIFDTMKEAVDEADRYAETHNVVSIIIDGMEEQED